MGSGLSDMTDSSFRGIATISACEHTRFGQSQKEQWFANRILLRKSQQRNPYTSP
jgi:hypothetical protein